MSTVIDLSAIQTDANDYAASFVILIGAANNADVVHKTGNEDIAGVKTFTEETRWRLTGAPGYETTFLDNTLTCKLGNLNIFNEWADIVIRPAGSVKFKNFSDLEVARIDNAGTFSCKGNILVGKESPLIELNNTSSRRYQLKSGSSGEFVIRDETTGIDRMNFDSTGVLNVASGSIVFGGSSIGTGVRIVRALSTVVVIRDWFTGNNVSIIGNEIAAGSNAGSAGGSIILSPGNLNVNGQALIATSPLYLTDANYVAQALISGAIMASGSVSVGPITKTALLALSATATAGEYRVTDSTPAQRRVWPDGTNWRYMDDGTVVV